MARLFKKPGIQFLAILFFLGSYVDLQAQFSWQLFNTANSGLPDNNIRCLLKDNSQNLWVGTDNGLALYNGTSFTVFDSSNSPLPVNQIRSLAQSPNGKIWIGTLQAGVAVIDTPSWWYLTSDNSLLPDNQVRSITFDQDGRFWLGTAGGVVYESDEGLIVYNMFNSPLGANNVNCITVDAQNTKWIGTVNGGISKKEANTWTTYTNTNSGLSDNTVFDIEKDIFGSIWFATPAQGIGRFNGTWYYRNMANSQIPTNSISCIEVSPINDVKYIGTIDKGLLRWANGLVFDSFTVDNSPMPENEVTCLLQYNDSVFYIGTRNSGLVKFTDATYFPPLTAIEDVATLSLIKLFPNPASNYVIIQGALDTQYTLKLFNLHGKLLKTGVITPAHALDVSEINAGLYMVEISQLQDDKKCVALLQILR